MAESENKYGVKRSLSFRGKGESGQPVIREHKKVYRISRIKKENTVYAGRTGVSDKSKTDNPEKENPKKTASDNIRKNKSKTNYAVPVSNTSHSENSPAVTQENKQQENGISPDIAERMKRAAFLEKLNGEKIKLNTVLAGYAAVCGDKYSDFGGETVSETPKENPLKKDMKSVLEKAVIPIPEAEKVISPEMAKRLKRAAFIEQKNAEAIRLSRVTAIREEQQEHYEEPDSRKEDETICVTVEQGGEEENQNISEHSETVSNTVDVQTYRREQAYHGYYEKKRSNRSEETGLEKTSKDFQTVSELAKGNAAPIAENAVRDILSDSTNFAVDIVSTVGGSVKNSDSAGSAVMDISAALAAIEAKKLVKNLAETDVKKSERAKDRAANSSNRYGIDKYDEVTKKESPYKSAERTMAEKFADEPKGKVRAGSSHKMREEKKEYSKKQKSKQIRQKRKEIFIRDNPTVIGKL